MEKLSIRVYKQSDYQKVKAIYLQTGWFDKTTDSSAALLRKIKKDNDSILVATVSDRIVGTISIMDDGRIAILFRLVAISGPNSSAIRGALMQQAEILLKKRGRKEIHILSINSDAKLHKEYLGRGYNKGRLYRWLWKIL